MEDGDDLKIAFKSGDDTKTRYNTTRFVGFTEGSEAR